MMTYTITQVFKTLFNHMLISLGRASYHLHPHWHCKPSHCCILGCVTMNLVVNSTFMIMLARSVPTGVISVTLCVSIIILVFPCYSIVKTEKTYCIIFYLFLLHSWCCTCYFCCGLNHGNFYNSISYSYRIIQ